LGSGWVLGGFGVLSTFVRKCLDLGY
jgi:hypothetical protein